MTLLDSQNSFTPPIAVNFIWNPADAGKVSTILNAVRTSFARSKDRPFSRGLNIPLFYFSSENCNESPNDSPKALAESNIVFVFTSVNTLGRKNWVDYIEGLATSPSIKIVPIAIDRDGLNHSGSLSGLNCIRAYDWPLENKELHAIVFLAHEIYRYGCIPVNFADAGKQSSITIFLSHAKAGETGRLISEEIKRFIDTTNMNRFFDATEITPGFDFSQEIQKHIPNSTLLAIETDKYSSRYWCQREILSAKISNRPIVVLNCLDDFEDRIFPAASNVPCIHISANNPISKKNILRVLSATIVETIRYCHSMQCLEKYKSEGWIDKDCELSARPPEIRQVLEWKDKDKTKICYPEPPIYLDESDWLEKLGMEAFTPLWRNSNRDNLMKFKVGISISDVKGDGFYSNHIHPDHLVRLAQDLARHLLARSAILLYGGDLRPDGFTEFILDEATILKDRIGVIQPHVENHLAWPLYVSDQEIVAWRSRFRKVMDTVEYDIPDDVSSGISQDVFLEPNNPQNLYIWSRCLTEMRKKSISNSTARICAGGKLSGYKGKMPGVLEEVILALNAEKPVFLLGAFGGVIGDVCTVILDDIVPDSLTEDWQVLHNEGYSDLQKIARSKGHHCDYDTVVNTLKRLNVSELSARAGLTELEYKRLMLSPFIDECNYLILKGLSTIINP
jgi:hypothetical protein